MTDYKKKLSLFVTGTAKWIFLAASAVLVCSEIPAWLDEVNNITELKVTATTDSSITLGWPYIESPAIAGYNVYRDTTASDNYAYIGKSTSTTYTDKPVMPGMVYYYKVAAYNSNGKMAKQSNSIYAKTNTTPPTNPPVTPPVTPPSGGTFVDSRGNKTYNKVAIGSQEWMAENLDYNADGSKCYDNNTSNCNTYGRLYNWSTAMGLPSSCNSATCSGQIQSKHQGVCPKGWHIPTNAEWDQLYRYADGTSGTGSPYDSPTAGTKLKSKTGWNAYSGVPAGTDEFGFAALPGGYGSSDGSFGNAGYDGYWWSATEYAAYYA